MTLTEAPAYEPPATLAELLDPPDPERLAGIDPERLAGIDLEVLALIASGALSGPLAQARASALRRSIAAALAGDPGRWCDEETGARAWPEQSDLDAAQLEADLLEAPWLLPELLRALRDPRAVVEVRRLTRELCA